MCIRDRFVPSHGILETDIVPSLEQNLRSVAEMCSMICETCREYRGQDEILQQMYERLRMHARPAQHALLSSTVKSYLTYLQDRNKLECRFVDNIMKWRTQEYLRRVTPVSYTHLDVYKRQGEGETVSVMISVAGSSSMGTTCGWSPCRASSFWRRRFRSAAKVSSRSTCSFALRSFLLSLPGVSSGL